MKFLLIYHGGHVPQEEAEQNINELWRWIDHLKERGIEEALVLTRDWPELQYGGKIDILQAL